MVSEVKGLFEEGMGQVQNVQLCFFFKNDFFC